MFREAATNSKSINLEEYTSSVTSYISKCIDDMTISKTITTGSNQKPYMTAKVHAQLKQRDSTFEVQNRHRRSYPQNRSHIVSNLIYPSLLSQSQTAVVGGLWNCQSAVRKADFITGLASTTHLTFWHLLRPGYPHRTLLHQLLCLLPMLSLIHQEKLVEVVVQVYFYHGDGVSHLSLCLI
ncbi:hypothetical protein HF521_002772 [Silurus meridionalis]|uniref:Uncharacterized protein n=1 Tax=Silurus meridionalis TaxID=175797 RepID=A0A8T0B0W2_SILME|nr:hypothetical protein HF521_002772 [Silurus meridionalis]